MSRTRTAALKRTDARSGVRRSKRTRSTSKDRRKDSNPPNGHPDVVAPVQAGLSEWIAYQKDLFERSVLFWDTLRRRANNMLEHERAGLPPLLDFKFEMLLDAREFDTPANYALLRITEVGDDCWEDCVDPDKPPVVVFDPRAGHGPGIGGFKRASEVGMALHEGHPVYFIIFFPEPAPRQTLGTVQHALREFVDAVARRHPAAAPVLYGNCQAGWAVTLLSADCDGVVGPAVLNGSPLSYWAGETGLNPMRVTGGLMGGSWPVHFLSDIGNGRFDGAWLAAHFENLKPEKAIWEKFTNLLHNIDTERERFLEFERWWNGFYFLSREEIVTIVENLFIGNELEQGHLRIYDECAVDLRRIRNPLIVFASYGDNITPPHQALGWIPYVYENTKDLKSADQRIIYLTNPHVGHLGIFVSSRVARLEHRAILESLEEIEALPPGLYEMIIENPTGDLDCHKPQFSVAFEERDVEDLRFPVDANAFESVHEASDAWALLYDACLSPWVRRASNPWSAEVHKWLHPMRSSRYLFSEQFNPWMRGMSALASSIEETRSPLTKSHPFVEREAEFISEIQEGMKKQRIARDVGYERAFECLYALGTAELQRGSNSNGEVK